MQEAAGHWLSVLLSFTAPPSSGAGSRRVSFVGLPLREGRKYIGDICELNFTQSSAKERMAAAWDLKWEDVLGAEDEFTIPEVIVMVARMRGWG